ncbi:MAG: ATP-binding protein, partial [Bacteroidales bacterium]|nr:ATP-binding protein [Bacteroidales bacterium]
VTLSIACSRVTIKDKDVKILAVNNISDDIEANEVEAWTRLIRVLTHEIMNSISPVASLSETLSKFYGNDNAELKEGLDVINRTSRGLIDFVESYRSITRINKPMRKAISFKQLINNILTLEKEEFSVNDISVEVTANRDDIMLYVDESQISQVIINVIKNAIQANANKLKISAFIDKDEVIRIEFANNGAPISKSMSEQIFVPFYTTKPSGSGIGLSISKKIMQNHDGAIQLLRSNEKETVFVVVFR